jgi:hypothetical protein
MICYSANQQQAKSCKLFLFRHKIAQSVRSNRRLIIIWFLILFSLISFIDLHKKCQNDSMYNDFGILTKAPIIPNFNDEFSTIKPTLIFTCLGARAFTKYQSYIWQALDQVRLINPNISLVVILSQNAYGYSVAHKLHKLKATVVFSDDLLKSNTLLQQFRQFFFEKGSMKPEGNDNFVQYVVERLIAVFAYMKQTGLLDVFHMENDNMVYIDLQQLAVRMHECNVSIAMARATTQLAITSFVFIRNVRSIEHFAEWCVSIFRMGPEKASQFLNTTQINDMTLGARYLQLFAASFGQSRRTGIFELPTWFHPRNTNCCLCHLSDNTPIIFDACVLGQYFGGTFTKPDAQYWEPQRLVDPRGLSLEWQYNKLSKYKRPYIKGIQIINLHVHSKQLHKFSSLNNPQTKAFYK